MTWWGVLNEHVAAVALIGLLLILLGLVLLALVVWCWHTYPDPRPYVPYRVGRGRRPGTGGSAPRP
jgi:hypothetical protein